MPIVEAVKQVVKHPVIGQGKLCDPAKAESAIAQQKLDYIALAHQLLADPYWPNKVKAEAVDDIVPCIGCNECLLAGFSGKHYYCAVNPLCYAEKEYALPENHSKKKSVLVIGGGPGGMSAAITAARRGFSVELWEKSDKLGGNLWGAGLPTFKHDVLRLITYMEKQIKKLGITVHLNKEAKVEQIPSDGFDKVILATGSRAAIPPIQGIEFASPSDDYLRGLKKPGKKVVVIGGGLVGCETAAYMKETADEVTIVEMLKDILAIADHCLNNDQALRDMLSERKVNVVADAKVLRITPDHVTYLKDGKETDIQADTVIIAAGYHANNSLEEELEKKVSDLTVIGDAQSPRKIINAVHEGYHTIRVM